VIVSFLIVTPVQNEAISDSPHMLSIFYKKHCAMILYQMHQVSTHICALMHAVRLFVFDPILRTHYNRILLCE